MNPALQSVFGNPYFPRVAWLVLIALIFLGPAIWLPLSTPWRSRQETFFNIRVPKGFAESADGRRILRDFRRRVWLWTGLIALLTGVWTWSDPIARRYWPMLGMVAA